MRKLTIILVAVLLIGTIAATGCTSNQMPKDNNQIPDLVFNSTNSTNLTNSTNTTHNVTAVATVKPTATPAAPTVYPTPAPTPVPPAPKPSPIPTPKPQCTHVDIVVYHPLILPCSMCTERYAIIGDDFAGNQYVTVSFAWVDNSTWVGHPTVTATVRETGVTTNFNSYSTEAQIEAWANSHLTCK